MQPSNSTKLSYEALQQMYYDLIETSQDLIWQCDEQGRYTYLNSAWEKTLGYDLDEMVGKPFSHFQPVKMAERDVEEFARLMSGGTVRGYETVHRAKDGHTVHLSFTAKFMRDGQGNICGTCGTAQDVTSRKEAEIALLNREQLFTGIFEKSPALMAIARISDHTLLQVNNTFLETLGYTRTEVIGKTSTELGVFENIDDRETRFKQFLAQGFFRDFELTLVKKDGTRITTLASAECITVGTTDCVLTSAIDITTRKQAELQRESLLTALSQSESVFRSIIEASPMGMHMYELTADDRLVFTGANPAANTILGIDNSLFIGKTIEEAFPPLAATEVPDKYRSVAITGITWHTEQVDYDDNIVRGAFHVVAFKIADNRMAALFHDITEYKRIVAALKESEEKLRMISDNLPNGAVYQIDSGIGGTERRFTYLSAGMSKLHELPFDAIFNNSLIVYRQIHPDDLPPLIERETAAVATMESFSSEVRVRLPSGALRWRLFSSAPRKLPNGHIVWDGIEIDITERKQLEETLHKTQRLESLGILAGGIAHDFNNLLGGIFGCIDLAAEEAISSKAHHYLFTALNTLDRARNLTQQLLTFSKGGAPIKKTGQLPVFIKETVQFALSGSRISCSFNLPDTLWLCHFDQNQIGQVIDNIVINAQQSMPEGGTISFFAENVLLAPYQYPQLAPGPYVKMSVRDTGIGMPREILSKIFDPFFTTKAKGHGLGLATCYSIITRHDGCIDVESEPGKGSAFHIYLPASPNATLNETIPKKHRVPASTGTILVMDDEEVMRSTISAMLTSCGYAALCAANGDEAIDLLTTPQSEKPFVAAILDLTIPGGRGGKDIVDVLRLRHPHLLLFVASGYANDPVMADPPRFGFTASISKPFVRNDLAALLQKHLERTSPV